MLLNNGFLFYTLFYKNRLTIFGSNGSYKMNSHKKILKRKFQKSEEKFFLKRGKKNKKQRQSTFKSVPNRLAFCYGI